VVIARGDVVRVDFGQPRGSEPAKLRPAVVVQEDWLLATKIRTVLVIPLTSNTALEGFPGNVFVPAEAAGLERDSVALTPQLMSVSREFLEPYPIGRVPHYLLAEIATGIKLVTGI